MALNSKIIQQLRSEIEVEKALVESERLVITLLDNLPGIAYRCLNDASGTSQERRSGSGNRDASPPSREMTNCAWKDLLLISRSGN
jgi:hypothetical protein